MLTEPWRYSRYVDSRMGTAWTASAAPMRPSSTTAQPPQKREIADTSECEGVDSPAPPLSSARLRDRYLPEVVRPFEVWRDACANFGPVMTERKPREMGAFTVSRLHTAVISPFGDSGNAIIPGPQEQSEWPLSPDHQRKTSGSDSIISNFAPKRGKKPAITPPILPLPYCFIISYAGLGGMGSMGRMGIMTPKRLPRSQTPSSFPGIAGL